VAASARAMGFLNRPNETPYDQQPASQVDGTATDAVIVDRALVRLLRRGEPSDCVLMIAHRGYANWREATSTSRSPDAACDAAWHWPRLRGG
jgi:hypothetical protein